MRHGVAGRKLGRRTSHREAMLQNLVTSLYRYGRVFTTVAKAKEARSLADHLIVKAKEGSMASRRYVLRFIPEPLIVKKLFSTIAQWNPARKSGFTRILKVGWRKGDAAPMALWELLDLPKVVPKTEDKKETKKEDKKEVDIKEIQQEIK